MPTGELPLPFPQSLRNRHPRSRQSEEPQPSLFRFNTFSQACSSSSTSTKSMIARRSGRERSRTLSLRKNDQGKCKAGTGIKHTPTAKNDQGKWKAREQNQATFAVKDDQSHLRRKNDQRHLHSKERSNAKCRQATCKCVKVPAIRIGNSGSFAVESALQTLTRQSLNRRLLR